MKTMSSDKTTNALPPVVLSIAGSDNLAGAGIQADLKTCSSLGVYCLTAITAITVQKCDGVKSVQYVGDKMLMDQLAATVSDVRPDAVKIGMLPDVDALETVVEFLKINSLDNIVVDPVLAATGGGSLTGDDTEAFVKGLVYDIFPLASLITPNLPEMEIIMKICGYDAKDSTEKFLKEHNIKALLLKGGHSHDQECTDTLYFRDNIYRYSTQRIKTNNTHGTGCTLSSAIASFLAKGLSIPDAVALSKEYISVCIERASSSRLFPFNGPLYHFQYECSENKSLRDLY